MNSPLADMLGGLDAGLDGAACAGHWHLFDPPGHAEDPDEHAYRLAAARGICDTCPVLTRCAEVADVTPKTQRAGFIWAGVHFDSRGRATNHHLEESS